MMRLVTDGNGSTPVAKGGDDTCPMMVEELRIYGGGAAHRIQQKNSRLNADTELFIMPPSRVFSLEHSLEQLKLPWSSENAFSVLAKCVALDEALVKIREKWKTFPLICQRQLMIMLASELEAESSLASHIGTLASHVLASENADGWLRHLAASSIGASTAIPMYFQCHPLFSEHALSPPQRTPLPEESVVCSAAQPSRDSAIEAVARAPPVSKTFHFVSKPVRPSFTAPIAAVSAPTSVEVYKPKHIAELVDCDEEEPEAKKGPQKKKRCR